MADDLATIFADSKTKAENASNIAYQWANGADTLEIPTDSGNLPSLRKFMLENVSEASNTKLDVDMSSGDVTLTSGQLEGNLYFRTTGNTVLRILTIPSIPKGFYLENTGTAPLTVRMGTVDIIVAPSNATILYADGTTNGLKDVLVSQLFDNFDGAGPPTVNDDITQGYSVGSTWVDSVAVPAAIYRCLDNTAGAANWVQTSLSLGDLGSIATQDANNVTISGGSITGTTVDGRNVGTDGSKLDTIATNANNYTHPNHSGQVTSTGDGATVLTASAITAQTLLAGGLSSTDQLLLNDGGVIKKIDISLLSELYLRIDNSGNKDVGGNAYLPQDTLTDGATITWTPANGSEAFVTLSGNRTLALNAVPPAGTWLTLLVRQDGTGSRTLAYNATYFTFGDAGTPVLSTAANVYDILSFRSNGTRAQFVGIAQGYTA